MVAISGEVLGTVVCVSVGCLRLGVMARSVLAFTVSACLTSILLRPIASSRVVPTAGKIVNPLAAPATWVGVIMLIGFMPESLSEPQCEIEGCMKAPRKFGEKWCGMHYIRAYRNGGDPGPAESYSDLRKECVIDDCTRKGQVKTDWCDRHARRARMHNGDPLGTTDRTGESNTSWRGNEAGYGASHYRVIVKYGNAKNHFCVECLISRAVHWAYDHTDDNERFDSRRNAPYSTDPDRYRPMCVSCHKSFDLAYLASIGN